MIEDNKAKWFANSTLVSLPIIPLLLFYIRRSDEFTIVGLIQPIVTITLLSVSLTIFFRLFITNSYSRGLVANILLYFLTAYSSIAELVLGPSPVEHFLVYYGAVWILSGVFLVLIVQRLTSPYIRLIKIFGFVCFVFLTSLCIVIGNKHLAISNTSELTINYISSEPPKSKQSVDYPNIIYIVLDEYSRSDVLEREFEYDNSSFCDSLERLGFEIMDRSRSNYWTTTYSLASSLNYHYLDTMLNSDFEYDALSLNSLINKNAIMDLIRSRRGRIYSTNASMFRHVYFDNFDSCLQSPNSFERIYDVGYCFWGSTAFHPLLKYISRNQTKEMVEIHKERIEGAWDGLQHNDIPGTNSFVFAHFLSPHPPFLFGSKVHEKDGNYIGSYPFFNVSTMSDSMWIEGYTNQIEYVNSKVLKVLEAQMSKSIRPIIIIQGDHGMRDKIYKSGEYDVFDSEYLMRFTNFSAIYFPDQDYSSIYDSMSNVNTWRVVMNKYFGSDFDMLEDRCFDINFKDNPFKFTDITEKLDSIENSLK